MSSVATEKPNLTQLLEVVRSGELAGTISPLGVTSHRDHAASITAGSPPPSLAARGPPCPPKADIRQCEWHVRFGSEADICAAIGHVGFTPNSDRKSRHLPKVMSALPPKADMCGALTHVCFGPIADISSLIGSARWPLFATVVRP